MAPRSRLHPETHQFIRRGQSVLGLTVHDLSLMFEVSAQRIHQILADTERVKVDGKWTTRKRGSYADHT